MCTYILVVRNERLTKRTSKQTIVIQIANCMAFSELYMIARDAATTPYHHHVHCMKLICVVVFFFFFLFCCRFSFSPIHFCRAFKCAVRTELDNAGARTITPFWRQHYKGNKEWTHRSNGRTFTTMDIHWSTIILYHTNHDNW